MFLYRFTQFLGWVVVAGFVFELMNYVLKYVNKRWISKMSKNRKAFVDRYRRALHLVVKSHRFVGIFTAVVVLIHFILMFVQIGLSVSGIIALTCLLSIAGLGAYGAFLSRDNRGKWLVAHRSLAIILVLAISVHLIVHR